MVSYLSHPNGWWRENAQKLLVLRNDKSVVPDVESLLKTAPLALTRIHALWTLDGMESLKKELLFEALKDVDPKVRKTAVWASENFFAKDNDEVLNKLELLKNDPDGDVRYQLGLSMRFNKSPKAKSLLSHLMKNSAESTPLAVSQKRYDEMINSREEAIRKAQMMVETERKLVTNGEVIFKQLCAACHGSDGKGLTIGKSTPAPALAENKDVNGDPEKLIKILLHGLKGPIDNKTYPDVMPALGSNDDTYIASVLSYIRNDLGNKAKVITADDVKKVREKTKTRTTNWTMAELNAK